MARRRRPGALAGLLVLALLGAACNGGDDGSSSSSGSGSGGTAADPVGSGPADDDRGLDDAGLTPEGVELVGDRGEDAPRYEVAVSVEPTTGAVDGTVRADLPVGDASTARLRYFPALVDPRAAIDEVTLDGEAVDHDLDGSILAVPLGDGHDDRIELRAAFGYNLPQVADDGLLDGLDALGEGLQPADIGLLGRSPGMVMLGHWFPVWVPDGLDVEPTPDGFGDVGNFPAATIQATIDAPEGWTVISGGVPVGDGVDRVEAAVGLRDLGIALVEDAASVEVPVASTTVRVVGRAAAGDPALLDEVAAEAATALEVLADRFGAYPWTELDVVATPLGSGVGGMEWPGMVWIEEGIFAGDLAGLGALGELEGLDAVLEDLGLGGFGELLDPVVVAATRAWTVAHEVGHQWWHAVVGNDSMLSPTVDEPLAQYSACLVFRTAWPQDAEQICAANTAGGYEQMRLLGEEDAAAAQPSDAFASSTQYGGVVYGKAPGLYDALAERFGRDALVEALAGVVREHAFAQVSTDQLRATLAAQLGDPEAVDALWARWMEQAHGDEDLGVDPDQLADLGLEDLLEIFDDLGG